MLLARVAGCIVVLCSMLPLSVARSDVEIQVQYKALHKMLHQYVFTDSGRHYMQGSRSTPCAYAFLSDPKLNARADRLVMVAKFDGQAGVLVNGECVGLGDTFPVTLSGVPVYQNGVLRLDKMTMEVPDQAYADLVRSFVQGPLAQRLRYPLLAELRKMLVEVNAGSPYRIGLTELQAGTIVLGQQAMTVHLGVNIIVD